MNNYPSIDQLLPHDAPMIMIDRAIDIGETTIHCQVDIGAHNIFFNADSNSIPSYVGIEFMAQSIAAWSGYHSLQQGLQPPIGFLLGSRRYHVDQAAFLAGQTLDIFAEQVMQDNGMAVFKGRIEIESIEIAQCQLNVYVPSEQKLQEMKLRS